MSGFLALISGLMFICLVLATGMHPVKAELPGGELRRRSKHSEPQKLHLRRYEAFASLSTLFRALRALFLVIFAMSAIVAFGWLAGAITAVVVAVCYPSIARIPLVRQASSALYGQIEPTLLEVVARLDGALRILREPSTVTTEPMRRIHSREDLAELLHHSADVIGKEEQRLVSSSLEFFGRSVSEVMTPRSTIDSIKKGEFMGPLVLDELHALGHSRLPVIDGDLDHVVGVLHLRDLLSLDIKRSTTAEKAMEKRVFYIREDDTLEHALAAFLKTRHHLFIVINENRETVGLLSLEDVIEALIGRQIVDEDDIHENLRAVAEQSGRANNSPKDRVDL